MTEQPRDVWGSVVPVDVVGDDDRTPRQRSGVSALVSGGAVIGVLGVVISMVMAAGIFAAASLSGGGPQPEDVLPGTSFAFAKLDLDPSAGQKLAIRELASKFPKAPAKEAEGLRDEWIREIVEDDDVGLSYERDVKPWLGRRAGIAGFRPASGEPTMVAAIQTKDRGKTEAALRKAADGEPVAFDFRKGYVILTEDAEALRYALDSIDKGALAEDPEFASDRDAIGRDQVALGWVDNVALAEAVGNDEMTGQMRGRSVIGLHAGRNFVEVESMTIGGGTTLRGGPADTLRRLPSDTAAAVFVHDAPQVREQAVEAMGAPGYLNGMLFYPMYFFGAFATGVDPEIRSELCYSEPTITPAQPPTATTAPPAPTTLPPSPAPKPTTYTPPPGYEECEEVEPAEEPEDPTPFGGDYAKAAEIFGDSVMPLLKDQATLALGGFPADEDAPYRAGIVARVNAPGNAVEPFQDFLDALGVKVPVRTGGDLVYSATEQGYLDQLARDGKLGEADLFEAAMGELGDSVVAAGYVNLDAAEKAYPEYEEDARPIDAAGVSMTAAGDRITTRLRIVVG